MKFTYKIYIFAFSFIFFPSGLISSNNDVSLGDLFTKFFDDEQKPINLTTLRFTYGVVSTDPNFPVSENIATSYNSQIDYGFSRIKQIDNYPTIFEHSSEFAFLGNITSHLKPKAFDKNGITIDSWRFGFGLKNGMGYNLDNGMKLFLTHTGELAWTRTDFEFLSRFEANKKVQMIYDEKMKFGTIYSGGAEIAVFKVINLSLEYEHALVFNQYSFGSMFGAWMTDNLLQRWIDFLDPVLIKEFGTSYPLVKWIYKNSVSLLLSNIRSTRGNFPFNSSKPLNFQSANFRIVLLL